MATSSDVRNEAYLSNTNKTKEICFVNDAFDGSGEQTIGAKLNNVQQNIAKGNDVDIQHVITNDLYKYRNDSSENKKENNNEISADNIKKDNTIAIENKPPRGINSAQKHFSSANLDDKYVSASNDINLKRSLSFGDKPSHRKSRENKSGNTVNELRYDKPTFDCGSENSSSYDSAISGDTWRLSLEEFTSKRQGSKRKQRKLSKQMRSMYKRQDSLIDAYSMFRDKYKGSFYKSQDELINQYEEVRLDLDDAMANAEQERKLRKKASIYAKATFAVNFVLLIIKVVAVVMSGSISLISSLVDSSVDLLSGIVIWVTARAVKKTDRYSYPQGRTKLEPLSIVILAVIMSVASLQIIKESFTKIFGLVNNSQSPPNMNWMTIGIASATVVIKLILYILCRRVKHPTVQALAQDHRNDVLSNFVAIVFGYLGSTEMQGQVDAPGLIYIDPIGAIIISIYIIVNWIITGWDQIKILIGHTATSAFISKVTWIAMDHHKKIEKVDTVRAFHFGHSFLVEVDIVLPPEMTLMEAHDIAEPLQQKIESLVNVERAFVHIDYEATHDPKSEHKVV